MSIPQSGGGPIERPDELARFLERGSKPEAEWRIGTEHEKFGYLTDSLLPVPYKGERSVRALLDGLSARGWEPIREGEAVPALMAQLREDPEIGVLVLGAGTDAKGPGPLVAALSARAGSLPVPITIVPGDLSKERLEAIT